MSYGFGLTNSDATAVSDARRAKAVKLHCTTCGVLIRRGLRCGPCRADHAEAEARRHYLEKRQKFNVSRETTPK